jgi:nucleotide-binding universal stress UspA family protein
MHHILVASAGSSATAAIDTAHALAKHHGATVDALTVYRPAIPYPSTPTDVHSPAIEASDRPAADQQVADVRRQLVHAGEQCAAWPLTLEVGHPAWCISRTATNTNATLTIIGIGRPDPAERPRGDRTALGVVLRSTIPVLAVAPGFTGSPQRMLIAVGLDAATVAAARFAAALFRPPEVVHLVHVLPAATKTPARPQAPPDEAQVTQHFEDVRQALGFPASVRVETHTLSGDPAAQLLEFAQGHEIDLIVGGLHGVTSDERVHIRNTALRLLSATECSVLIAPQHDAQLGVHGDRRRDDRKA